MYKESPTSSPNKLSMKQPLPDFIIRGIPRHMEEDPETGWHRRILFNGPTSFLDDLCAHGGLLSGHVTPHPPHCHEHEELHIALSENLEFVGCDADSEVEYVQPIDRGSLLFTDSNIPHSFRNNAPHPAAYLHIRWKNTPTTFPSEMKRLHFYYSPGSRSGDFRRSTHEGSETIEIYSGPTRYLSCLRALFVKLRPGSRIPFHRHAHEVIFIFISGSVEILGRKMDTPGFAFLGTRVPHYIVNHGPEPAAFYAFELHQEA